MTTETTAQRQIQKLQRAVVDGLEDVKAQDIRVFNTEALSPLFERVIIASGTSNRQTKALASSVRDAVREAGFAKPRVEGEENGEWIIVDCGRAVVHIMQPAIRQYYHLEELWGGKPVTLRHSAAAKAAAKALTGSGMAGVAVASRPGAKAGAAPSRAAPKPGAKTAGRSRRVAGAASSSQPASSGRKPPARTAPARKSAAKAAPRRTTSP